MGTELQYAASLFTTLPKKNTDVITIGFDTPESWSFSKSRSPKENIQTGFTWLQGSMDRLLEECNRESLRNTMLKHDRIFKEQVRELHRLYEVQKILMAELRGKEIKLNSVAYATPGVTTDPGTGFWCGISNGAQTTHSPSVSGRDHHNAKPTSECDLYTGHSTKGSLSAKELGICSGENLRVQRGFDLGLSAEECTATGTRVQTKDKMCVGNLHLSSDEESEIELTLSIGCSRNKKKSRHHPSHLNVESGCSGSTSNGTRQPFPSTPLRPDPEECGNPSASSDRERPRPSWPFQVLSLNRT